MLGRATNVIIERFAQMNDRHETEARIALIRSPDERELELRKIIENIRILAQTYSMSGNDAPLLKAALKSIANVANIGGKI